ncbi:amidohydrolase [Microvirga sp. VF16]|uniref:amidohydrolase family protein n=1 Tax=Microvirga sp. VF16 TaxID=2807101 RepID=UPI00193E22BC|nr:amidohydrolase family protein [Microvirga sp. VF16]QRM29223.1 amidohydrolase family protein [Microvirga sp. VF16]
MTSAPMIPPPHPNPHVPSFKLPPKTCDTHCHIFGPNDRYPYVPERPYTPPDAPLEMFRALHDRLGVERAVIVNATPHGRDNRVVTDAIAQSNGRYKGVANVDETFSDRDLRRLADAGITGCRFTFLPRLGRMPDMSSFDRIVERIAALDWHVDLYLPATLLPDFRSRLTALPVPYVLDHMGVVDASLGLDQPAFVALLDLVQSDEKCWVKVTCPERISRAGPPFHDVAPFGKALIDAAPDRVLWGTDWPHPNVPVMPDDGDLVDLIPLYAPDPAVQHKLLVENPARLFRFAD